MGRRAFRILLILVLVALSGAAGWQVWSLDRTRAQQREAADLLQRDSLRIMQAILDLRASQRAYLSPGQGITAWKPRVDAHINALREHFHALREQASASSSPFAAAAAQADDEALDAMVASKYLEQRITDHVNAGRLDHAADLMYADGVQASLTLERAANAAFVAHAQDLQYGRRRVQVTEGLLLGLAGAIGVVLALLLMPARKAPAQADAAKAEPSASGEGGTDRPTAGGRRLDPAPQGLGLASGGRATAGIKRHTPLPAPAVTMAADLPLHAPAPVVPMASTGRTAAAAAAAIPPEPSPRPAAPKEPVNGRLPQTDGLLAAAAELTVSVARVGDLDGLKPVMARLADHLDAVGLIVWLEDASTQRLMPIVTHGYPAETLAHLPPIDLDADNATARAWRLAELQVVAGRGPDPGAIVVPMPSSAGCVGVVAAEVRHGREHDPATLALARILAAQLAMLTGARG